MSDEIDTGDELQISDEWDFYPCRVDDQPASILINLRFMLEDPRDENDHVHHAFLSMKDAGPQGVGTQSEMERLSLAVDVETCRRCGGRMRLLALITEPQSVARFLRHRGEPTEPPARAPPRDPPYFKTLVVRRRQPTETSSQRELFEEH